MSMLDNSGQVEAGQYSPDGMWVWNGHEWVPVAAAGAFAPAKQNSHTWVKVVVGVVLGLLVLAAIGIWLVARAVSNEVSDIAEQAAPTASAEAPLKSGESFTDETAQSALEAAWQDQTEEERVALCQQFAADPAYIGDYMQDLSNGLLTDAQTTAFFQAKCGG